LLGICREFSFEKKPKRSMASQDIPQRPPNCRIFLGNLASERTSKEELQRIFSKYGEIVEDIVMRRSFGFIQYDNPDSASAAIAGENGRMIGGMRVGNLV
jgi:RNA recognition motif-containing protein